MRYQKSLLCIIQGEFFVGFESKIPPGPYLHFFRSDADREKEYDIRLHIFGALDSRGGKGRNVHELRDVCK